MQKSLFMAVESYKSRIERLMSQGSATATKVAVEGVNPPWILSQGLAR